MGLKPVVRVIGWVDELRFKRDHVTLVECVYALLNVLIVIVLIVDLIEFVILVILFIFIYDLLIVFLIINSNLASLIFDHEYRLQRRWVIFALLK